jgi:2-keto-4-pentenoate hydratase/2-oxohepta-3-ene-1,7-dioic acid hydratase in catechol pathway
MKPIRFGESGKETPGLLLEGETRLDVSISDVPTLISYVSQFMTLLPGDIISSGTSAGVGLGMSPPR